MDWLNLGEKIDRENSFEYDMNPINSYYECKLNIFRLIGMKLWKSSLNINSKK